MPLILVVARDGEVAARIEGALGAGGWRVERVAGVSEAMESIAGEAPDLFLVDSALEGAESVLGPFARRRGGPGTVALVAGPAAGAETAADVAVSAAFTADELRGAVAFVLEADDRPATTPAAPERKLTSSDIFGDLVDELDAATPGGAAEREPMAPPTAPLTVGPGPPPSGRRPGSRDDVEHRLEQTLSGLFDEPSPPPPPARRLPASDAEIEHRLEQTLSGVFGDALPTPPAPPARPPAPPALLAGRSLAPAAAGRSEVDDLLDATLDGLGLSRGGRSPRRIPAPGAAAAGDALLEALPGLPAASSTPEARRVPMPFEPPLADVLVEAPEALRPPSSPEVAPGTPFGQYRLLERIGVGGMAEVWKARMTGLEGFQKTVAIKKILPHLTDSPDFVEMFIDEAKLAAELNHANIIHIYDLGKIDQDYYIAMEYVEGENLRGILDAAREADRRVPLAIALYVTSHLASALDHAHRRRDFEDREMELVHRDVSPQNVLIGYEGTIKLCDFGIVKAVAKASHTQMGALKGKLQYMSPEQAWGRPVDGRSDIFSLGSILFELLTGRRLFTGASEMEILEAVREARVVPPSEVEPTVPPEIDALVLRALARAPEDRFATAGDMARRVDEILQGMAPRPGASELAAFVAELFGRSAPSADGLSDVAPAIPAVEELPLIPADGDWEAGGAPEGSAAGAVTPDGAAAGDAAQGAAAPAPVPTPVGDGDGSPLLAVEPLADIEPEAAGARRKGWLVAAILVALALAMLAWFALRPGGWLGTPAGAAPDAATAAETDRAAAPAADGALPAEAGAGAETPPDGTAGAEPAAGELAGEPLSLAALAEVSGEVERLLEQRRAEMEPRIRREFEAEVRALEERSARLESEQAAPPGSAPGEPGGPRRAPAEDAEPVAMGPGVPPPQLVTLPEPEYPPSARQRGMEGEVVLSILVDEAGRVVQTRLEKGVAGATELDQAALAAAANARYRPAMKDGEPVKMWTTLRIPFKL